MPSSSITINELKVLSALQINEQYGLEILKSLKDEANTTFFLGTLYNLLSRLEDKGFVTSKWKDPDDKSGGHRRRYYKITGSGVKVLNSHQKDFIRLWNLEPNFGL